ncbi:unnamed protein product, partial [Rotaria sp. Silwood2]
MMNIHEKLDVDNKSSPFIICPITDINKITYYGGIYYGSDQSLIPWPTLPTYEQNYATWLHETLMEISEFYRK